MSGYPGANRPHHQQQQQQQYDQYGQPQQQQQYQPQQQQFQQNSNFPQHSQYNGPPPPMHYGQQNQNFQAPPASYGGQNQQVHMQPPNRQQYGSGGGKRKALCVGINYTGTSSALAGCHNDARNISKFLCERYNFKREDIVMLMDVPGAGPREIPTRANMIAAMQWLVSNAHPNDSLWFSYSGHGGQAQDLTGDEDDGYNETVMPLDFKTAGQIIDDDLHSILVKPLPAGCRLTAIFDSCHSGTVMDLPYVYSTEGKLKEPNLLADAGQGAMGAVKSYMRGDIGGALKSVVGFGKKAMNGQSAQKQTRETKTSNADVVMWSGCKDSQTSADASEAGKATGAMSWAFIEALTKYPQQSYNQLLNSTRDELRGRYDQKPQLSCSHELDCNLLFII